MKKITRIVAAMLTVVLIATTLGCTASPPTVTKYENEDKSFSIEVPTGVYICAMIDSYNEAKIKVPDYTKDMFDNSQKIDEKLTKQWIIDDTIAKVGQYVYINKMMKELGIQEPTAEIDKLTNSVDQYWNDPEVSIYPNNGVSKESVVLYFKTMSYFSKAVFDKLYAAGGSKAVSDEELKGIFDEKYIRIKLMIASLYDSKGAALPTAEIDKIRVTMESYVTRINNGEAFDKVHNEFFLWNEEREVKFNTPNEPFTPTVIEPDKDISTMKPEEIEEYISGKGIEQVFSKDNASQDQESQLPPAISEKFNSLTVGNAELWTNSDFYIAMQRFDINERPTLFELYRTTLLSGYKSEEFAKYLKEEAAKLNLDIDKRVVSKNSPTKLIIKPEPSAAPVSQATNSVSE